MVAVDDRASAKERIIRGRSRLGTDDVTFYRQCARHSEPTQDIGALDKAYKRKQPDCQTK